jgi:hypothetical protein
MTIYISQTSISHGQTIDFFQNAYNISMDLHVACLKPNQPIHSLGYVILVETGGGCLIRWALLEEF